MRREEKRTEEKKREERRIEVAREGPKGSPGGVQGSSRGALGTFPGDVSKVDYPIFALLFSCLPFSSSQKVNETVFFSLLASLPKCSIICVFSSGSALGRSLFRSRLVSSVRPKIHPKWSRNWCEKWVRAVLKVSKIRSVRSSGPFRPFGLAVSSVGAGTLADTAAPGRSVAGAAAAVED